MNLRGIWAIYKFEMHRFRRTLWTGLAVSIKRWHDMHNVACGTAFKRAKSISSPQRWHLP